MDKTKLISVTRVPNYQPSDEKPKTIVTSSDFLDSIIREQLDSKHSLMLNLVSTSFDDSDDDSPSDLTHDDEVNSVD